MNLRRLNYILIRGDAQNWERWSRTRTGRLVLAFFAPILVLTAEGQILLVTTLLAGAAGMDVQFSNLYLVFCGLFGLLMAAWLGRFIFARPGPLTVHMRHPNRVAVGQPVTFTAELSNPGSKPLFALRVFGPFLPWDATWTSKRPSLDVLGGRDVAQLESSARFLARGDRVVGRFHAASVRPLGLSKGSRVASQPVRIVVVPRTVTIRGLGPPPLVPDDLGERARGVTTGADYELAGLRPYRPGDRIRDLHALSWARLGQPMVRTFRRTARRQAIVLFDPVVRRIDEDAFEAAVTLAASLVRWAVEVGAHTTLVVAGEHSRSVEVGPQSGPVDLALDLLAVVQPAKAHDGHTGARLLTAGQGRTPIYAVLADWDPEQSLPPCVGVWVVADRRAREEGVAGGAKAVTAQQLNADTVDLS